MSSHDILGGQELLTVEETANYLRVAPNTVYRWCRDGKLTAIKLGKEWRISPGDLEAFVSSRRTGERMAPVEKVFSGNLRPPEHVLVMMTDPDAVYELEAEFFQIGRQQGRKLYKGCWWQHPDDVRQQYAKANLPVDEWEREGWLAIEDFRTLYRARGPEGVFQAWIKYAQKTRGDVFWGAGSHLVNDWGGNFSGLQAFEQDLHAVLHKLPVVALCCCVVAPAESEGTAALINLAAHHTGSLFVAQGDAVLMRPVRVN
jgi:excisionase family DNA binding protein